MGSRTTVVRRMRRGHLRFRLVLVPVPVSLPSNWVRGFGLGFGNLLGSGGVKGSNLPVGPW